MERLLTNHRTPATTAGGMALTTVADDTAAEVAAGIDS
jgi:hypothetical protein